jgi:hypothetical protein
LNVPSRFLPLSALLPLKTVPDTSRTDEAQTVANRQRRLGLSAAGRRALEGPKRVLPPARWAHTHAALVDIAATEVRCLIAEDDEAYTYNNKRINRLATVQEHFMVVRAIERGVPEDKLAKALNLDIKAIQRRRTLLVGICPEVVELLKDKSVNPRTFDMLRKMKPMRQIEAAELMATAGNYAGSYAKALLAATRQDDLVNSHKPKRIAGMTPEQMARMEREMDKLQRDLKTVESRYGEDVLQLVIASGYLSKLVANPEVKRYLNQHHPEILSEFRAIISSTSLDHASNPA